MENALSFKNIPHTTRLYNDYLYDFDKVERFFNSQGKDIESLVKRAAEVTAQSFNRDLIANILLEQNKKAGASEKTIANIELLRRPDSVVVITGQQAGLFTGPLYTILKALTALKLTSELRDKGLMVVPMFWIASEDHDFAEVDHTEVINRDGNLVTIKYAPPLNSEGNPVGNITLDDSINNNIEELLAALPESEFTPQLKNDLQDSYRAGEGYATAFGKLLMKMLSNYGIVLIDPLDEKIKQASGDLFLNALSQTTKFADQLVNESSELEKAGYHAQVHVTSESVPLFILNEGKRTAMQQKQDGKFHLKGIEKSYALNELTETMKRCPSCFSPNATLRPIVQDFLLPTLAYIGGAAEIAYFAQIRSNYKLLGRIEPVILPRASFTLIETRQAKTLNKNDLTFEDLFKGREEIMKQIIEHGPAQATIHAFEETEKIINQQLDRLSEALTLADKSLAEALKGGRDKVLYQVQNLRTRFINNRGKQDETTSQQIDKLFSALYPNKNLQEREINIAYFLSRYGYQLIDRLYEEIEIGFNNHKLIYL